MLRNPNTARLTKEYIESKISQETIVSKYLDIPLEIIQDCINNNHLIPSVFRENDTNGSMGFAYNKKGRLKVRDFGGFGFFEDVYGTVAYVLSVIYNRQINTNNKNDFYFILKHIANTFSDIIDNKTIDESLDVDIKSGLIKLRTKKPIIEIAPRSWNKYDKELWGNWGISLNYLNTHFVVPVDQYYIDRKIDDNPKYKYTAKDPCYGYILGQNEEGIILIKLYFPLREHKNNNLRFITNCNVIEGILNLELDNYDYIILTKSTKDRLSIGCALSNNPLYGGLGNKLNIGIVNLPSESYHLKEKEYKYLNNKLKDTGVIISFLDFDATGRKGAKYLEETYGIPYIFITRGEFGLYNYGAKDFAELVEKYPTKEIISFIKETQTYINYDKRFIYSSNSFDEGISTSSLPY